MTGCTYGKGNLIHRDFGKNAFTFFRRADGRAIRIVTRPDAFGASDPERDELRAKLSSDRITEDERRRFDDLQSQRSDQILDAPLEQLFTITEIPAPPPRMARVHRSLVCARCGEPMMETRVRQYDGQTLCIPCFEQVASRF